MKAFRILATGTVAAALLISPCPSTMATASADGCPDVEVVFARGTSEPPGLGRVGEGLVNSLRGQTSRSVGAYAVNYPASYDFGRAADGANDASGHIMWMVENCPGTRLVLGGYSQGAAIIDIVAAAPVPGFGFTAPLPPEAADHVAAIAVFGNPSSKIGQPLTNSPVYGFKTIDLCTDGDPICSPGRLFSAHSGYTPGMTNQAASFVAGLL
ncbi:cutinase family protein [Mycolicibacter arupensis]|uniref:Cutinase n=1 Tax=Mycolicibacter arupensis TaxID=342002 RepID=A0A0F5MWG1_9MYCO|nr:cutinase family protein [Mycolicibacter arupensis]KAA1432581.1 cutinase family protein [Mycolicibacter arupensis]KKB99153.1 cutinase [Mycolicibacter arupensis]MCV7275924.1 cutinase family protein [Mycolicibacter arupensis]ORA00332.1 cutinase family protein [Mycolicibacter arupensis]TXI54582.1 MAG: cutinase family protein [Mycolicibacter arupensis]